MLRRPPQLAAHFVALTLTAVLLALSYPLPGWSLLAWIALAPAGWLAATSRKPWTLLWTSAAVFALWWLWMLRWLVPVTLPGTLAVAGFQSLFWVLALWATNVCVRRQRVSVAIALPLCWVSLEFIRSTWPWGGFAWFTLAQTQANWHVVRLDEPIVLLLAHMFGVTSAGISSVASAAGLSLFIAVGNGLLCQAIGFFGQREFQKGFAWVAFAIAVVLIPDAYGMSQWPDSPSPPSRRPPGFNLAVVQTNAPHDNKLSPTAETYDADFANIANLHAQAANASPALIVWPETGIPGPFNAPLHAHVERWANTLPPDAQGRMARARAAKPRQARELIAEFGVPTLVGSSTEIATLDPRDPKQFNSAYLVMPDGQVPGVWGRFDKMHRVPFGEYIPLPEGLKDWVLATVSPYDFDYSIDPGESITIFIVPARTASGATPEQLRFATPICFEDTNAALCRDMVYDPDTGEKRVDALVNLTTNGWFGRLPETAASGETSSPGGWGWKSMRYQHLQLASLRAIENRVPVVRSVNTGVSAIIDSTGRIVAAAEPGQSAVLSAELVLDPRRTVYAIVGDWPMKIMTAITAMLVLVARLRRPVIRRRRARRLAHA